MSQPPKFWLWIEDEARGPYRMDDMWRMGTRKEISRETLFWSEIKQEWRPLSCLFVEDQDSATEKLAQFQANGFTAVRFIGSGTGYECPICKSLEGQTFPIESAPPLPIEGCTCNPWPRCTWVGVEPEPEDAVSQGL